MSGFAAGQTRSRTAGTNIQGQPLRYRKAIPAALDYSDPQRANLNSLLSALPNRTRYNVQMDIPAPRPIQDQPDYLEELLAKAGVDAQASSLAAKLQEVVIDELHHRVKNTLAIVSAITSQSLRTATSLEQASKTISERLYALGVAQDLLIRERWTGADCRTLIESAVKAFQSKSFDQFTITGGSFPISSGPALSLSMVIHELCTNAVKYGALSVNDGRVSIEWKISDDDPKRFILRWVETGGPTVNEPKLKSFGSRLIEQALPGQLRGEARLQFHPQGLACEVNIPLSAMQER